MTIEQLAKEATDPESFSLDGNVVVQQADGLHVVMSAKYDAEKKQLVLLSSVARLDVGE